VENRRWDGRTFVLTDDQQFSRVNGGWQSD